MSDIFVFLVAILIVIRTFGYGASTISSKNISGGIFVFLVSAITAWLAFYLLILDRT